MTNELIRLLKERILILDGAMGSMIQTFKLTEQDFKGERFATFDRPMKGNNDMLCITRPDVIKDIHLQYLRAGADIIETNSFSSNAVSMEDYGLQDYVRELNLAAVKVAKGAVAECLRENPGKPRFVAGAIGPTTKAASMSPDVSNPAYRSVTFDKLRSAYKEQVQALLEGGVDVLLIETIFDTLNAKAAVFAVEEVFEETGKRIPIMLSVTVSDKSGRTLSGQTIGAFLASVQHVNVLSIGLNCSFGASDMKPFLKELSEKAPCFISAYPNAGLPNRFGEYDETPSKMAVQIKEYIDEGLVNILGGCCGTTPAHIATYETMVKGAKPHTPVAPPACLWLSGLELLEVKPENNFLNIGERCNVAGSRKFLRLIKEKNYEEALSIARQQVEDGAQVVDVNMDDALLETKDEMTVFLNLMASEPDIAKVPFMIDSSKWDVIEAGLKCAQGKCIVNSISLKEGEAEFLHHARLINRYGAAVVVMAFDETGQADSLERKIEICERAYRLLTEKVGFNPHNIIFDPNVLAIATGIEEHYNYGNDFINATAWVKKNLPCARVSGGVSNLSFSFRGNNYIREVIHSVFLYHAIKKGMDMGIVNASESLVYDDIPLDIRNLVEDVVLNRNAEATERLIEKAEEIKNARAGNQEEVAQQALAWRQTSLEERLEYALIKGIGDYLEEDLEEALRKYSRAIQIIDQPLMSGMNKVGTLFGEGKMFLPQVVKTARTMKKAVAILQPAIEAEKQEGDASSAGKMLIATVKGDVHDIGKNIVGVVMACNNYEIIDLGVMVPTEEIIRKALEIKPDIIGLSGLITPSLEEMCNVAEAMEKAGISTPLFIGGATTSKLHTAVKISPKYSHTVLYVKDASQSALVAAKLLNPNTKEAFSDEVKAEYEKLRDNYSNKKIEILSLSKARENKPLIDWTDYTPPVPKHQGVQLIKDIPISEVVPFINWNYFFVAWKLFGKWGGIVEVDRTDAARRQWVVSFPKEDRPKAEEAMLLYKDAEDLLDLLKKDYPDLIQAEYGFFEANGKGETIYLKKEARALPMLRQQDKKDVGYHKSLADYLLPVESGKADYLGAFAITAGNRIEELIARFEAEGNEYSALVLKSLCDRLAEAAAEYLHYKVRVEYWGYASEEELDKKEMFRANYQGIRPAVGYPSIPDQSMNFELDKLLSLDRIGVTLTEHGAMYPTATVSGFYFAHPESSYFAVGHISEEQLGEYAAARGMTEKEAKVWLVGNVV